ncbi:hypothetical protein B0H63DRAFT_527651 [Podospora didyma]|uniref:WW domain-containing protein n=1 Tax=Podospora didyma TaxID=330526 RepID=A0AAE0K5P6_9PEZI|nr:hypothetical protein B0H63DRAFT_527651 [Podospora didyma]
MSEPIDETPPSYAQATGSSSSSQTRNGIPLRARRSMEDELRALPPGWVREFDPKSQHQFFVDTNSAPSRSIWHHPYDDEQFLNSLTPSERERIRNLTTVAPASAVCGPIKEDIAVESTDEELGEHRHYHHHHHNAYSNKKATKDDSGGAGNESGRRRFGCKIKDTLTGTTHTERAVERERRCQMERDLYRQHQILRRSMQDAMNSGQPQLLGEDDDRNRVYLEPPGHTFPGVARVKPLSPYMTEVFYDGAEEERPGPHGRYVRPEGDMYGYGYGGYDCEEESVSWYSRFGGIDHPSIIPRDPPESLLSSQLPPLDAANYWNEVPERGGDVPIEQPPPKELDTFFTTEGIQIQGQCGLPTCDGKPTLV